MRELCVWGILTGVVMLFFFGFVLGGWPGKTDPCVTDTSGGAKNSCYCEDFDPAEIGKPGVRQPSNTWSNLYAIGSGGILVLMAYLSRIGVWSGGSDRFGKSWYALLYLGVVVFLGLGSMWFHASLKAWGAVVDNASMHAFTCFLVFYTLVRLTDVDALFLIFYPTSVIGLTVLSALDYPTVPLVVVPVVVYGLMEIGIAVWAKTLRADVVGYVIYGLALASFIAAVVVWVRSQTGEPMCYPEAAVQGHAVWHWLSGLTAFLLYFYWRRLPR